MRRFCLYVLLTCSILSCKNFEIEHKNFEYTSGYFPYQHPVRTLILGDDIYDNSNDNAHKFVISAAMGGVYANERDRNLDIAIDETLCKNVLFNGNGDTIRPLPSEYYKLSSSGSLVIPKGKLNGGVEVQLTDAFFNDPKAIKLGYVVPIRILGSQDVDSILTGNSAMTGADPRVAANWIVPPKNFTMFAIKYINEFHGNYFVQGKSSLSDEDDQLINEKEYKKEYVEQNPVSLLTTSGRNAVEYNTFFNSDSLSGELKLTLTFANGKCTVSSTSKTYQVTGNGEFKTGAYEWGNKKRNGIEVSYTVKVGKRTYQAKDVLVVRDRAVVMQVYNPQVF